VSRLALQVVDLCFGDSGKGTMVDFLVRRHAATLVVRFNGGPQAGHNVVLPDGRHHTFAQFGAGTFSPGVRTLLSRFTLIEPYALFNEADHLSALGVHDALSRLFIDERCLVITPPQQIANRLRERARAAAAHGTCGLGVGECVEDALTRSDLALRAGDLRSPAIVRRKLADMMAYKRATLADLRSVATNEEQRVLDDPAWIDVALEACSELAERTNILTPENASALLRDSPISVFEGAQGVLLDEYAGFHPHTTWSETTFSNADTLLDECGADAQRWRIGVMRTYMTRHGAGPFATEDASLNDADLPEPHNSDDGWQSAFRRGTLDLVMLRYALAVCGGVDALAVTHLDRLARLPGHACNAYDVDGTVHAELSADNAGARVIDESRTDLLRRAKPQFTPWPTDSDDAFVARLECELKTPAAYRSYGPTFESKRLADTPLSGHG